MSPSANVLAFHALEDLKGALARFGSEAQESLQAAEQEIRRTFDWLQERLSYWQNQVRQRQAEVAQAKAALARCQASGYRDEQGYYHSPDCSAYEMALLQAQVRLREAEAELRNVQEWTRLVQQATTDYQTQAQRLVVLLSNDLPKAEALLGRGVGILQSYTAAPTQTVQEPTPSPGPVTPPEVREGGVGGPERRGYGTISGVSWAEKCTILKRIGDGLPLTMEDVKKLEQPISDLQSGTLEEDERWIQQLLESERYRQAMRDSQEADKLKEAILAALKAINYWRSKP